MFTKDLKAIVIIIILISYFRLSGIDTLYLQTDFKNQPDSIQIQQLKNEAKKFFISNSTYSLIIIDYALNISEKAPSLSEKADVIKFAAYGYLNSPRRAKALKLLKQAENDYIKLNDNLNRAFIYNMFFMYYIQESKDDSVFYFYQKALSTLRLQKDKSQKYYSTMSIINSNIGNFFFFNRNENSEAKSHYDSALYYAELCHDTMSIAASYSNIGLVLKSNKKYEAAKENYEKAYQMSLSLGNKIYAGNILGNLGDLYEIQGNTIKSREYKIKAYKLFKETENPYLSFKSKRILAKDYYDNKEFNTAKSLTLSLLADTASIPLDEQIGLFLNLTDIYKVLNNTDSALYFHKVYHKLSLKKQKLRNHKATEEIIIAHKTQQALKENQLLTIKYNTQIKRHILLIIVSLILTVTIVLLILILKQRKKLQIAKRREIENENELLKEKLEYKNRELTLSTMNIIRHSEFVSSLVPELKEFSKKTDNENKKLIMKIVQKINMHNKTKLWEDFYKAFTQVNNSFFEKLNNEHPKLTAKERKLCALLKLEMNTKDIASITNTSIRGVETARHRLRKKLNISSQDNLCVYLRDV